MTISWRQILSGLTFLATCLLIWDISLRTNGGDAHLWRNYGDLFYRAIVIDREFPTFSYLYNAGSQFLSDTQSPFFSIWSLWVLLFGPISGSDFSNAFLAAVGFLGTLLWLSPKLGLTASAFTASAWILSSGFFWRIIASHDPFLVYWIAPWIFWMLDRITLSPQGPVRQRFVIGLGLLGSVLLWGPSYQALLYFILPASLVWIFILIFLEPLKGRSLLSGIAQSLGIAVLASLPRIVSFLKTDMSRLVPIDGTITLESSLYHLFQVSRTSLMGVKINGTVSEQWYFIWEAASALMIPASIFGVLGFVFSWRDKPKRSIYGLCAVLFVAGILLSSQLWLWNALKGSLIPSSIRVPSRFLGLCAFSLAVSGGLFLHWIQSHVRKPAHKLLVHYLPIALVFGFALEWRSRAIESGTLKERRPGVDHPEFLPIAQPAVYTLDRKNPLALRQGKIIVDGETLKSSGYSGEEESTYWEREFPMEKFSSDRDLPLIEEAHLASHVILKHGSFEIRNLPTNNRVTLKLRASRFEHTVDSEISGVKLEHSFYRLTITNENNESNPSITVRPNRPSPAWSWWVSGFAWLLGIVWFTCSVLMKPLRLFH